MHLFRRAVKRVSDSRHSSHVANGRVNSLIRSSRFRFDSDGVGAAVERLDDGLRLDRHLVLGAVGIVDQLLAVSEREASASRTVAGIGGCRRVTASQRPPLPDS